MAPPPPDLQIPNDTVEQEPTGTRSHAVLVAVGETIKAGLDELAALAGTDASSAAAA